MAKGSNAKYHGVPRTTGGASMYFVGISWSQAHNRWWWWINQSLAGNGGEGFCASSADFLALSSQTVPSVPILEWGSQWSENILKYTEPEKGGAKASIQSIPMFPNIFHPETLHPEPLLAHTFHPYTFHPEALHSETLIAQTFHPETLLAHTFHPYTFPPETLHPETLLADTFYSSMDVGMRIPALMMLHFSICAPPSRSSPHLLSSAKLRFEL